MTSLVNSYGQVMQDFYRLASGLRACVFDFDYVKTRKLLDPQWDGYSVPKGHDIIADDVDIRDANLLTSRHRDSGLHRAVLDLDYDVTLSRNGGDLSLDLELKRDTWPILRSVLGQSRSQFQWSSALNKALGKYDMNFEVKSAKGLCLSTSHDAALIPSTTPKHHHLILDIDLPWFEYKAMLYALMNYNIIEPGYARASIDKGFSAIRTPWTKKPGLLRDKAW